MLLMRPSPASRMLPGAMSVLVMHVRDTVLLASMKVQTYLLL